MLVEHAGIDGVPALHRGALDERLDQSRQPGRTEVTLAQPQHARRQPELLAVGGGIAEVHQAQQVAPCRSAGDAGARRGVTGGELRVVVIEGFDHSQALAQTIHEVAAFDRGRRGWSRHRLSTRDKPEERAQIAQGARLSRTVD